MSWDLVRHLVVSAAAIAAAGYQSWACAQTADETPWRIALGVDASSRPLYPGSGEEKTRLVPVLRADPSRSFPGAVPGLRGGLGSGFGCGSGRHGSSVPV